MAAKVTATIAASLATTFPMSTQVSFFGSGFQDGVYKAHLHADTCANGGGGHYNGGDGSTVDNVNENWPAVTCMGVRIAC